MFKPTIALVEVDSDLAFISIKDSTGDSPTVSDGYGASPDAPADFSAIDGFLFYTTYTGEDEVPRLITDGAMDTALELTFAVVDGVYTIVVLYKKQITTAGWTTSSDGKTITFDSDDPSSILLSAYSIGIADDGTYAVVSSRTSTTAVLETALMVSTSGTDVWAYYKAELPILVQTTAAGIIKIAISKMAINHDTCNFDVTLDVLKKILLKVAAETMFDCEDYVAAQNAILAIDSEATCNCTCS